MARMSLRERLMTVLRGGKADRVPFTIYEWIFGWAIPEASVGEKLKAQGLTLIGSRRIFQEKMKDVPLEQEEIVEAGEKQVITRIQTPVGEVTERAAFDRSFGSRWIKEHLIKSVKDYQVMKYVYDHTLIEPAWDEYVSANQRMGEKGIVLGEIRPIPLIWMWVELMGAEVWSEGVMLHPGEFESLMESVSRVYRRQVELAAESPAEVIWFGDNVTGTMVSPKLYNKYCKPIYDYACGLMKQAGKLSFAHYDGANGPLKDCIADVGLDIIEAFTPPPMEQMTVAEARAAWPDKVLSLNFPGVLFRESDEVIERYTRAYMEQGGRQGKFIIGCTEEFDKKEFEHAFLAISRAMADFEGVAL